MPEITPSTQVLPIQQTEYFPWGKACITAGLDELYDGQLVSQQPGFRRPRLRPGFELVLAAQFETGLTVPTGSPAAVTIGPFRPRSRSVVVTVPDPAPHLNLVYHQLEETLKQELPGHFLEADARKLFARLGRDEIGLLGGLTMLTLVEQAESIPVELGLPLVLVPGLVGAGEIAWDYYKGLRHFQNTDGGYTQQGVRLGHEMVWDTRLAFPAPPQAG